MCLKAGFCNLERDIFQASTVNTKNGYPAALRPRMPSTAQNSHLEIQSTNPNVHCWLPSFICISTYYGDITSAAVSILAAKLSWFSRAVLKSVFRIRDTVLIVTHINFKLKTLDQGNNSRLCVFHVGILSSFQNLKFGRCPSSAALPAPALLAPTLHTDIK